MTITEQEKIIAELAILHEISSFELLDSEESIGRNAVEKASRLFGIRYFAWLREEEEGQKVVVSWGFRTPADVYAKTKEDSLNQFRFSFCEFGLLFMEHSRPLNDRERRLYTIFARQMEKALMYAENTRQLLDAHEELIRKGKLAILGQLSESVGHELRNPLGVMSNAVYFLKIVLPDADESTREYLEIIKHEIDISLRIITDLLDFARTKLPQTMTVSVRQLLDESIGKCVIPENVGLQTDLPDTLPPLRIDPLQMGQVFQNFITNAIQAMPNGGALRVAARLTGGALHGSPVSGNPTGPPLREAENFIEISVTDTGEGIPPENLKKLFQPLFTTKARGIGLGLAVSKNLAEANGGRIEVESEPGKGTTFMVALKVVQ